MGRNLRHHRVGHNGGVDTAALLDLLVEVAETVVNPRFRALDPDQVMEKGPGDLVTVADRESEAAIAARLRDAYPDALIVGEEAVAADPALLTRSVDAQTWFTIDPIDGTRNFVKGSPDHAMIVAEMRGREVVRGVIWQPAHRLGYTVEKGAGAFADGVRMPALARTASPLRAMTATLPWTGRPVAGFGPLEPTWACCGVDYPRLAAGQVDALHYFGAMPWDHAAGSLILSETGGALGLLDGTAYDPTSIEAPLVAGGDRASFEAIRAGVTELRGA